MDGACSTHTWRILELYTKFLSKNRKRKTLWIPGRRWENNIKADLKETGCDVVDWIQLARDMAEWLALVNMLMNLRAKRENC